MKSKKNNKRSKQKRIGANKNDAVSGQAIQFIEALVMAAAVVGASAIAAVVADNVDGAGAGAGCASAMQFQTNVYMVLHVTRVS